MKLILTDASHTSIMLGIAGFAIALAVLFAFVVASEFAAWWRGTMLCYHVYELASRWKAARLARRCTRQVDRSLRRHGFTRVSHERWEKRG